MIIITAGLLGAISIILGAYGSHGLKKRVDEQVYHSFSNALRYHQLHTLVVLFLGLIVGTQILADGVELMLRIAAWTMVTGVVLFSGGIYLSIFTGSKIFSNIAPIGGTTFIIGWLILALTGLYL